MLHLRTCVVVAAALVVPHVVAADDPHDKVDDALLAKLQGSWNVVSSVFDGEPFGDNAVKTSWIIDGRKVSIQIGDKVAGTFQIKQLTATNSLGNIDYEIQDPIKGTVRVKQLFKLRSNKLTTCVRSPPGSERPSELTSTKGSKNLLTVSERAE